MENKCEMITKGVADTVDMLSLDEMDDIIGGDVDCKKRYAKNGVKCKVGYTQNPTELKCKKKFSATVG